MNIGIVTTWFERGAAYVSRQYRDILAVRHNVFIYGRGGESYGVKDPNWDTMDVTWDKRSVMPVMTAIDIKQFKCWISEKNLDIVFFNEQHWWEPVLLCNRMGVKTGAYIDYYKEQTIPLFGSYDFLMCNTRRHYNVFKWHAQAYYIPWGTDINLFLNTKPDLVEEGYVTFFHSAGMNPNRKGCDLVIKAFAGLSNVRTKLIIHSQRNLKEYFPEMKELITELERRKVLICHEKTVPAPGLYHLGDVYVYPSRLEGIGLSIAEALSCGLPVITSDNPPMNEFIDGTNGKLVKIDQLFPRSDGYYWSQCSVNLGSLKDCMQEYAQYPEKIRERKTLARRYAEKYLDWRRNAAVLPALFEEVMYLSNKAKRIAMREAQLFEEKRLGVRIKLYYRFPFLSKMLEIFLGFLDVYYAKSKKHLKIYLIKSRILRKHK